MWPMFLSLCLTLSGNTLRKTPSRRRPAFHRPLLETLEDRSLPSTFTVTNTLDDGSGGSLRWAINAANGDADPVSVIKFNIAPSGVQTIQVGSSSGVYAGQPLPRLTHPATIDGTTEGGYTGSPLIVLNGANAGNADGLVLGAGSDGSTLRGLVVQQCGHGVVVLGSHNLIAGNYIGTDATGEHAVGNLYSGIQVDSAGNTIGGTTTGDGNVISGTNWNPGLGVEIDGSGATGNFVEGNYIGTDATGCSRLPNVGGGVIIQGGATNNTIGGTARSARNVISGNGYVGVLIENSGTTGNVVEGNYIGTDLTGKVAVPNGGGNSAGGVWISGASNNTIGGSAPGAGNVISGSTSTVKHDF